MTWLTFVQGYATISAEADGAIPSEQDYIDALRAYTTHQGQAVACHVAPNLRHQPQTTSSAITSAAAAPTSSTTTDTASMVIPSPLAVGQWPRPENLIGMTLDGVDGRAPGRHAGAKVGSSGYASHPTHALSYTNGLTTASDAG